MFREQLRGGGIAANVYDPSFTSQTKRNNFTTQGVAAHTKLRIIRSPAEVDLDMRKQRGNADSACSTLNIDRGTSGLVPWTSFRGIPQ